MEISASSSSLDKSYEHPHTGEIVIGNERFRCPEALFQPSFLGISAAGIHEKCTILSENVILNSERKCLQILSFQVEVQCFQEPKSVWRKKFTNILPVNFKVVASSDRKDSVWLGGSIFASLDNFKEIWISKSLYEEIGSSVVHSMSF